ncbi:MAG: hypothetical protein IT294_17380 [Deltaproteobacteria bacterium]|nr:hypothetical protein [Deltaproteobacteria bacterium]
MSAPAEDPREVAAKRAAGFYRKGVMETVTELADVFLKKLPWKWLVIVVVAGGTSLLKFMVVPYLTSLAVQDWSERRGVRLEVGGWQAELWNLRVRATGLELKGADKFSRPNLLEASAVELDFGARYHLSQFLWGKPLWDILRLDLSSYGLSKVVLDHAVLYIERRMSGHGNWDATLSRLDLGSGAPAAPASPGVRQAVATDEIVEPWRWPSFAPRNIEVKQLKIEWIENLPGGSGGGLIRNVQETLYVDDVDVVAHGRYAGGHGAIRTVEFNLEGRTADGRLSLTGAWTPQAETVLALRTVLENVGANAFARMVPDPALVPVSGSMNGNVELTLMHDEWQCRGDLLLQNVAYQPVFDSWVARKNSDALAAGLRDFRANRRVALDCRDLEEGGGFGLVPFLQTAATAAAVQDAPKVVRAVARVEVARTGAGVAGEDDVKSFVRKAVAGEMGDDLAGAITEAAIGEALAGRLPGPSGGPGMAMPGAAGLPGVPDAPPSEPRAGRAPSRRGAAPAEPAPGGIRGFGQKVKNFFSR